jgi:hypothetical protein
MRMLTLPAFHPDYVHMAYMQTNHHIMHPQEELEQEQHEQEEWHHCMPPTCHVPAPLPFHGMLEDSCWLSNMPLVCRASTLSFSPDSSKLIRATMMAFVLVLDLVSDPTSARVVRRFDQHRSRSVMIEGCVLTGR